MPLTSSKGQLAVVLNIAMAVFEYQVHLSCYFIPMMLDGQLDEPVASYWELFNQVVVQTC